MAVFLGIILALVIGFMGGVTTLMYSYITSESTRNCLDELADKSND